MKVRKVPVETYSRIVGFFRPVQSWNDGKKEEFKMRHEWNLNGKNKGAKNGNS